MYMIDNYWIFPGLTNHTEQNPLLAVITNIVSNYYNLDSSQIYNINTRRREIVLPRQIVMYFAKTLIKRKLSLTKIGGHFNQNHATALHAKRTIHNLIETDKMLYKQIKELEEKIIKVLT